VLSRFAPGPVRAVTLALPRCYLQWLPISLQGKCGWIQRDSPDLAWSRSEFHVGQGRGRLRELAFDRKLAGMGVQLRRKLLTVLGLLMFVGALLQCRAGAQEPTGSLAGILTDTHSTPLQNVVVTLRNVITGSAISSTTSRGGRYRFPDLVEGEYTLAASSNQGSGEVSGIVISPGHESHVRAAIEFVVSPKASVNPTHTLRASESKDNALQVSRLELLARVARESTPPAQGAMLEASLSLSPMAVLPVTGSKRHPLPPVLDVSISPVRLSLAPDIAELEPIGLHTLQNSALAAHLSSKAQISAARLDATEHPSDVLDSAQLESLPTSGNWTGLPSFARESSGDEVDEERRSGVAHGFEMNVDNLRMRSAFGGVHRRGGGEFIAGESAISLVRRDGVDGGLAITQPNRATIGIETRRGSEHLHGQVSLFNRQRLFSAQNPFTEWVKETAHGSGARVPTFAGEAYTPSDIELRWGAGIGGALHRRRLFWFGALDGHERSYPAVAAVRHPDRFFAQPSNDQMQLLSAQLGLSGVDPVTEGVSAYSKLLESLAGLLGPAPRSSLQLSGFVRLDWHAGERHRFTLEGAGSRINSPGGGFTRGWQAYGTHSSGSIDASNDWLLGRWQGFVTPNLLAAIQGSFGRQVRKAEPESPSAFEQSLNINSWGQLPQIVIDAVDGFTIGNPARFGRGRYPNENVYSVQQQVKWVHGNVLLNLGGEFAHELNATTRLHNQTGTYHYSSIGDFASDALAFFAFGLNGQLNPMDQHNCDQRGRPWRDTAGVLHGLGYLPCYSYYSQTMGPSEWWLSTNDWAGYAASQWRVSKRAVFTAAMRWELEQLPAPIRMLDNPDLPLTQHLPGLGNQWGPRAGFAWGATESRWPVLRLGYGMYFSRTPNAVVESALTQTGSMKGNLNFFMRPTDNLHGGGAPPFPYVLAGEPGTPVKAAAIEFAPEFHNGEVHQADVSIEQTFPGRVHLEVSGIATLGRRLPVTMDANIDPAANPKTITYAVVDGNGSGPIKTPQITVPFFASWPSAASPSGFGGRLNPNYQHVAEIVSRANSTFEAMVVRLSRNAHGLMFRGHYTFGHAADWNPDEALQINGPSVFDPTDFRQEYGTSDLDTRHSATAAVILQPKWKLPRGAGYLANGWMMSGVGHFRSGLPYTMRTSGSLAKEFNVSGQAIVGLSTGMNGYGGDSRVYGIGRNTYRYPATWKADLRIAKRFDLGQMRQLELMAESFNLFNHQNVTQIETVGYSIEQGTLNGAMPRLNFLTGLKSGQTEFGKPLDINATDSYRQRQFQFGARMRF